MPSMRAVLERRERSAAVRVEELRAELERVRAELVEAEAELAYRVIGLEQYLEALADHEVRGAGRVESVSVVEPVRRVVARKKRGVTVKDLGPDYRQIMELLRGAGASGMTARQVAERLGWDVSVTSRVEGARGRMKRLVEREWLVEKAPGRFRLPVSAR